MENETHCKFLYNIKDICIFARCEYMQQNNANQQTNFLVGQYSTYSIRQRNPTLPSETAYKPSVKIDQIDSSVEPFPLDLTEFLYGWCDLSHLVWFDA